MDRTRAVFTDSLTFYVLPGVAWFALSWARFSPHPKVFSFFLLSVLFTISFGLFRAGHSNELLNTLFKRTFRLFSLLFKFFPWPSRQKVEWAFVYSGYVPMMLDFYRERIFLFDKEKKWILYIYIQAQALDIKIENCCALVCFPEIFYPPDGYLERGALCALYIYSYPGKWKVSLGYYTLVVS